jgi:DNA-binding MarR family transcriptional regulator
MSEPLPTDKTQLCLPDFFPYQLTQLQAKISDSIAELYTGNFDLSRQEWRVLATLGSRKQLTAKQIGVQTNIEKMPASRAISRMLEQKLVVKKANDRDKRSSLLKLTSKGLKIYQQLVPMVLQREQELLSALSYEEIEHLQTIMTKLADKADEKLASSLNKSS